MHIGGMGTTELVIILAIALLVFGPKNLPKLGTTLGKTVKNIRKGMDDGAKEAEPSPAQSSSSEDAEEKRAEDGDDESPA